MSTSIRITDDGDDILYVKVNEETVAQFSHDEFGWAGMEKVIDLVEEIADSFGITVHNTQDIV